MEVCEPLESSESPRSTVVTASASAGLKPHTNIMTQGQADGAAAERKLAQPEKSKGGPNGADDGGKNDLAENKGSAEAGQREAQDDKKDEAAVSPTPQAQMNSYLQGYPAHLTPQPGAGYYLGYGQTQVTPEPPSPAGPGPAVYDVGSFFQQPAAFAHNSPFGVPQAPLSPRRSGGMGGIPPASPLFPRVSTAAGTAGLMPSGAGIEQRPGGAPPSPSVPAYLSPPLGPSAMYQGYPGNGIGNQGDSPDELQSWVERNQQNAFAQGSPQINAHGMPVPYVPGMTRGARSYSFEETMLPPAAAGQEQGNPAYSPSPYGHTQNNGEASGGTLFAHQQPWGYAGDMYGAPASPLQPRPAAHMPIYPGQMGGAMRQNMGLYGQYYPATSPGPPIQTTDSNKGPDGANLFIFHIPNHFTNLDMYNLFCPYGNLLSVRIMVEKDTGRSRGFGFVSYDSPASAALAIKELNGFAIGNKRLKVQHKQIRPSDQQHRDNSQGWGDGNFQRGYGSHLPPSGPMAAQNMPPTSPWYDAQKESPAGGEDGAAEGRPENNVTHSPGPDGPSGPVALGQGDGMTPLSNLEPLRNALPDE